MILRPRLIVQATTFVWVCFMGLSLWLGAIWSNYESFAVASNRDRGNGVKPGLDVEGIGTLTSTSGGQEPPSLPGNPVGATAPNSGATLETPDSVRSSSPSDPERVWRGVASAQGVQVFEDGAAWKDTQQDRGSKQRPPASLQGRTPMEAAGIKPGRHLRTLRVSTLSTPPTSAFDATDRRDGHLRTLATSAANLCGVPVALFHSLIERESSWRPYVVSSSGAVGLAQVKPSTARDVSPGLDVHDPWQNLVAGSCYLRQQYDRFGTWRKALKAYHGGPNRTRTKQATHDYADDVIGGSAQ